MRLVESEPHLGERLACLADRHLRLRDLDADEAHVDILARAPHDVRRERAPPCGIYRTIKAIGGVEAGRFVYFHNHGNPGPGVYFPESWAHNRARFSEKGTTVPENFDPSALQPLRPEGFYRVITGFHCCEKQCTRFEPDSLVQLGYNGAGKALVFIPELGGNGMHIPDRGSLVDDDQLEHLAALKVPEREGGAKMDLSLPRGMIVH